MSKKAERVPGAGEDDIHFLMDSLWVLYNRMSHSANDPARMNVLEAYQSFKKQSRHGKDCTYVKKCVSLFKRQDFEDLKSQICQLYELFKEMEK